MRRLWLASVLWLCASDPISAEIPRDGSIKAPSSKEAAAICKMSLDQNASDRQLLYCVVSELESAENVIKLISESPIAASDAYWICADNPYIQTFTQLNRCMELELESILDVSEEPASLAPAQ